MINCGKCKTPLTEMKELMGSWHKCDNCNYEVYEVSGW